MSKQLEELEIWLEKLWIDSDDFDSSLYNKISDKLSELKADEGEWISVNNPPKENGVFIVWDDNNPFDKNQCIARYSEYNNQWYIVGSDTIHPQFYRPLPNPPKP